jgi:6-pyruvoyltetrahydropterin/6-carboxytetrahydropterin synthase
MCSSPRSLREKAIGMYSISVEAHYDSAHLLRDYEGKCARLHGHRYVVQVVLQAPRVGRAGMVYDFGDLKRHLKELAEGLDHRNINEVHPFTEIESTAENQARYFFEEMKKRLPEKLAEGLLYARVAESPGQWAQYGRAAPDPEAAGQDRG